MDVGPGRVNVLVVSKSPASRPPGGRGAGLTREQIVEAAIALMDEEGVDAMTVRALARRLGVQSPALYWHFAGGKDEICEAVVAEISGMVEVTPDDGPPLDALTRHVASIREHWLAHPSALELSRRFPPTVTSDVARSGMELLRALGVPDDQLLDRYRSLAWTAMGFVIMEQNLGRSVHHAADGDRRWRVVVGGSTASTLDTDALFASTVAMLLAGLVSQLA